MADKNLIVPNIGEFKDVEVIEVLVNEGDIIIEFNGKEVESVQTLPKLVAEADIGIVGASPRSLVYRNGEKSHLIDTNQLVDEIETMVRQRVQELEEAKSKEIIRSSS